MYKPSVPYWECLRKDVFYSLNNFGIFSFVWGGVMGKGPKTKHGIYLCLKPTLYITYSKGSYMHLVIVCMKQFLVWSSPFVVFWQSKRSAFLKDSGFQFFIFNASVSQLIFSWSPELGHFLGGGGRWPYSRHSAKMCRSLTSWNRAWARLGWIPAQGTKGKAIACVVSGFATILRRRTMMLI